MTNSTQIPNRLINEKSPYLLQHAYNPVDWWPWCDEAFAKAKAEDKPVFLSTGYSTCHWCHVMEHESFEDHEVAEFLNRHFISVKVDREERPDVDAVYMGVCQVITGSGGWPLTILMTPDKKPFYAGTYLPKRNKYGNMGLVDLLRTVTEGWETDREALTQSGQQISEAVAGWKPPVSSSKSADSRQVVLMAVGQFTRSFDPRFGGFGRAPKFPTPHNLMFLLRYHILEKDPKSLEMVETTLRQMYKGGIFDHIGFGFSRYSTDERWLAPHFEKMLYDNALMVIALAECFQITKKTLYKEVADKTLQYVFQEMTSPDGGFFSAQDADSDGVEGKFYTFTPDEIMKALGKEDGTWFCGRFDITEKGNFDGVNIPNLIHTDDLSDTGPEIPEMLSKLYEYRRNRTRLHKDDKILTAWNALMIVACAKAYRAFGNDSYLIAAKQAFRFISKNMMDESGLKIFYRDGDSRGKGLLDDYAFFTWACLELYESDFNVEYLSMAITLSDTILRRFSDPDGGFFITPKDGEALIYRPKEFHDGALPAGNSVFALCLTKLAAITAETRWVLEADRQISFLLPIISDYPQNTALALTALTENIYPTRELICVLRDNSDLSAFVKELGKDFRPNFSVIVKTPENEKSLSDLAPYTKNYPMPDKEPAAFYFCQSQSCSAPVYNIRELIEMLNS